MTVLIEIPQNSPDKVNHNIIHLPFFLNLCLPEKAKYIFCSMCSSLDFIKSISYAAVPVLLTQEPVNFTNSSCLA